eukprot:TRINITY_DN84602_c0_g1_i1.p1 TRINITY_DN84602_c0_g1~~TRINITY_DN84602_c0_g1_i1.p1  ORF type:complete len:225 (-),score=20.58 TRINITY_DN84602_c0_g1_i1:338-1012(-)
MSITDPPLSEVAAAIMAKAKASSNKVFLVAIAGVPASGKSTLGTALRNALNEMDKDCCVSLPMDGFHYTRAKLQTFDDPEEAFKRRGAEWTFDAEGLVTCLTNIKTAGHGTAPSFDHGVGDPVDNDIVVQQGVKIVLMEGLYLTYCGKPEWQKVSSCFDYSLFLDCDMEVAMERLAKRHMASWNFTREQADNRINTNDRLNAELVLTTKQNATQILKSVTVEGV